jgi:hypothetical protein
MSTCSANLVGKLSIKKSDPCPAVGKGSYKVANVCKSNPYVYYTPRSSKKGFRESIDDLLFLEKMNKKLRDFYMIPKCVLQNGVPGKTDEKTVVVSKLTGIPEYMERKPDELLQTYTDFVTRYLKDVSKHNSDEIWKVVSTDFKPDNIMVDGKTGKIYITDFSPMRQHVDGFYSYVTTPIFVLGNDFNDFKLNKKYTPLQISKIAYHINLLCVLSTLYHLISTRNLLTSGHTFRNAESLAFHALDDLVNRKDKSLASRQKAVMKGLRKLSHAPVDMSVVETWLTINPFGKRPSAIERSRQTKKPTPAKKPTKKSSKSGCSSFLSALKRQSIKAVNPITGRQILKKGPDGKPTALVKKLVKHCQ